VKSTTGHKMLSNSHGALLHSQSKRGKGFDDDNDIDLFLTK